MVSPSSLDTKIHVDLLRKCQLEAQQLKSFIEGCQIPMPPSSSYSGPIPHLHLPFPCDILLSIESVGLPDHLCQQVKAKVTEKITEFQRICTAVYMQTCRDLPGPHTDPKHLISLAKMYYTLYNDYQIPKFRAQISTSTATMYTVKNKRTQDTKRPTFNFEYIPFLEKYFENNAYPSRPDRVLLARKSLMSERQIEVWFQNHRNRAKKEGIPLKRLSPQQSSPMELLGSQTNFVLQQRKHTPNITYMRGGQHKTPEEIHNLSDESFTVSIHNPHVFPTPYHHNLKYSFAHPSQQAGRAKFPPPNWPRKTASMQPPPSVNMEEFVDMFASKLSIRRGAGMKAGYTTSKSRPWFYATITVPSHAPHPALVHTKAPCYPPIPSILPRTTTSSSIRTAPSISNASIPRSSELASRARKTPPFTFRTPQKLALSSSVNASLSVSQPFSSRTPSSASVSSSDSRSTSLSNGSSPGPATPPHSPTAEPCFIQKPSVQESNLDDYVNLFAGIVEPQYQDLSQNFDYLLSNFGNEDILSKHLNLDSLYANARL
ncbi:hypothetical protein BDN70DRAFT_869763 [Pholiota conissans]|uniref:Homeobox domain-containing protein n=1 Tax=Pholiota conissans TaxID=109636 RepID=A0A9P5ZF50_9AGAR|nr:hypothetical protein BDN70DRAFT_869763 [Pholiota conissans]